MSETDDLTIKDLARLTGFPSRSIHHYISRGLLPGPEGKGPAARYSREHVLRLKLIEHAQGSNFKIDQRLQKSLDGLSLGEMEQLVAMADSAEPEEVRRFGEWLLTGDWRPEPREQSSRARSAMMRDRMPAMAEMIEASAPRAAAPEAERERRPRKPIRKPRYRAERWERFRIDDVLEISWQRPRNDSKFDYKLEELLRDAERLFGHYELYARDRPQADLFGRDDRDGDSPARDSPARREPE